MICLYGSNHLAEKLEYLPLRAAQKTLQNLFFKKNTASIYSLTKNKRHIIEAFENNFPVKSQKLVTE